MHWLLASLLVLPPRTGPLPLVGLKRDARRTELVFQLCLCLAALLRAGVDDAMSTTLPRQKHAPIVQLWMGHTGSQTAASTTSLLARTGTAIHLLTNILLKE